MESFALENASAIISTNLLEAALKNENNEKIFRSSTLNSAVSGDLELFFKTAPKLELVDDDPFEEFWKEESTLQITQLQAALSGDKPVATDSACVTLAWDDTIPKSVKVENQEDTTVEWTRKYSSFASDTNEEKTLAWEGTFEGKEKDLNPAVSDNEETLVYVPTKKRKLDDSRNSSKSKRTNIGN